MSILDEIIKNKIIELEETKKQLPLHTIKQNLPKQEKKQTFLNNLLSSINQTKPALIAEIKFASPSKGIIRTDLEPEDIAKVYNQSKFVDCISVLTEKKYFKGDVSFINRVKNTTNKPILRKDFIFDEYQVFESVYYGADAILLIATALTKEKLKELYHLAKELGLDILIEIYDKEDIPKIENLNVEILGINSRNLKTLDVSLAHLREIVKHVKDLSKVLVAESGIKTIEDVKTTIEYGFNAFLIGETLMKSDNIESKINELFSNVTLG